MANQFFSVKIPTTTHLKKFLLKRMGNPVAIKNNSLLGIVLIGILSKEKFTVHLKPSEKQGLKKIYVDVLPCTAPISLMTHYGFSLSLDQAIQINRFYDELFDEALYLYCARRIDNTKREKGYMNAIFEFAAFYDIAIGVDITYDCLKKKEQRYRQKIANKLMEGLSPHKKQVQMALFI